MDIRLFIINKQFAVFSISARLDLCLFDDGKPALPAGRFLEDDVHFFERAVGGFGVDEVDNGDDEGVAGGMLAAGNGGERRKTYMTAKMM